MQALFRGFKQCYRRNLPGSARDVKNEVYSEFSQFSGEEIFVVFGSIILLADINLPQLRGLSVRILIGNTLKSSAIQENT